MTFLSRLFPKRRKLSFINGPIQVNYPLQVIKKLCGVKDNMVIFDVGAYVGNYSVALHEIFPNAEIYAFEPFNESFKALQENVKQHNQIKIFNTAISNYNGEANLYVNSLTETNSLLASEKTDSVIDELIKTKTTEQVKVVTVDQFCHLHQISSIDFLKIDIQGNGLKALEGCKDLLKSGRIRVIQVEVEFIKIYKDQHLYHHIASYLEEFGYEFYSMYNLHFEINERLSWSDAIFIKKKSTF